MDVQYLKSVLKYSVTVLLSLVLIAYILYHMSGGFQTEIETVSASLVTTQQTATVKATIMREEHIIYAPIDGDINYLYEDGDKVGFGSVLAEVYSKSDTDEIRKTIIALDKKIRLLEQSNMSDSEKRTDTASTDKLIWDHIFSLASLSEDGKISDAATRSDKLLVQLNRRRIITKNVSDYDNVIEILRTERDRLYAKLSSVESTVVSDKVGYFYSTVDGYENIFSSSNIGSLSYSEYLRAKEASAENFLGSANGYPIGKLVTDYRWYMSYEISSGELHNYQIGKYYDIKFPYNNGTTVNMYLYRIISDVGTDRAVLIFRADVRPAEFKYLRNQTVQVVQRSYTGYRVPVSAVHVVNGKTGVYVLKGSQVVFRRVETLFEYDGYFIVKERDNTASDRGDWLAKNDFVIVKGKDLYDGKIVN